MVGWTWPTKDDESSTETEQKTKSQAQQNRSDKHDGQSSTSEDRQEEKVTSVPLRLVLFPTEDELSLSQMTPSSSFRALNCNPNSSSRIRFDDDVEISPNNLQPDEIWQQCYKGSDADDRNRNPQWANQDSQVSFYVSQSFPSPANSPEFEEKPLLEESNSNKDVVWQSFGEESRLALCTEDLGSELERLEVRCNRFC